VTSSFWKKGSEGKLCFLVNYSFQAIQLNQVGWLF